MIRPDSELTRELLDLLQQIFVYDPSKRVTAEQALRHRYFRISSEPPLRR
jgi:serine/threonine protein kinase